MINELRNMPDQERSDRDSRDQGKKEASPAANDRSGGLSRAGMRLGRKENEGTAELPEGTMPCSAAVGARPCMKAPFAPGPSWWDRRPSKWFMLRRLRHPRRGPSRVRAETEVPRMGQECLNVNG